ncbi:hypothetical protein MRX96_002398 [Rhipicephalus microplus]
MATVSYASLRRKAVSLADFLSVLDPDADQINVPRHDTWYDSEPASSTICKFRGIKAVRNSGNPMLALEEPCRLGGYRRSSLPVYSSIAGCPFARRVKLSIVHPKKPEKNLPVELKICQEKHAQSLKRPQSGGAAERHTLG